MGEPANSAPAIAPDEWLFIGPDQSVRALALTATANDRLKIAFIQHGGKCMAEFIRWQGDHWDFADSGPSGQYVEHLRARLQAGPLEHQVTHRF